MLYDYYEHLLVDICMMRIYHKMSQMYIVEKSRNKLTKQVFSRLANDGRVIDWPRRSTGRLFNFLAAAAANVWSPNLARDRETISVGTPDDIVIRWRNDDVKWVCSMVLCSKAMQWFVRQCQFCKWGVDGWAASADCTRQVLHVHVMMCEKQVVQQHSEEIAIIWSVVSWFRTADSCRSLVCSAWKHWSACSWFHQ